MASLWAYVVVASFLCLRVLVPCYLSPCYPVTLLPCYPVTLFPCYPITLLPCYLVTLLPCYPITLLPCYLVTLLPCYPVILLPCYLVTLLTCYLLVTYSLRRMTEHQSTQTQRFNLVSRVYINKRRGRKNMPDPGCKLNCIN